MTVRVIRTIEYVYDDQQAAEADMSRWTWYSKPEWSGSFRSSAMFGPAIDEMEMVVPPLIQIPAQMEVRVELLDPSGKEIGRMHFADHDWHSLTYDVGFLPLVAEVRALLIRS